MMNYSEKYEGKINMVKADLEKKQKAIQILEKIRREMEWDVLKYVEDDSEEGHHFEDLAEDDWKYNDFLAYKETLEVLEKHFFGK